MKPLWLDYQRTYPGERRLGWQVLATSLVASGLLLNQYFVVVAERDDLQQQLVRLKAEATRTGLLETPVSGTSAATAATAGRRQNAAPPAHSPAQWESLFASLETAADDSVTLLALQPGIDEITISGEAKSLAASLDYLQRLQSAKAFVNAHLTQSESVTENPQRPLRFTLAAQWRAT